jgi:hypothetical protein
MMALVGGGDSAHTRLAGLLRALTRLTAGLPGAELGAHGTLSADGGPVDAERGVDLRLASPEADVVLRIHADGARLTARSRPVPRLRQSSEIRDDLGVRLDRGYRWGAVEFGTPDRLAAALLAHVRRRSRAVCLDGATAVPQGEVEGRGEVTAGQVDGRGEVEGARAEAGAGWGSGSGGMGGWAWAASRRVE